MLCCEQEEPPIDASQTQPQGAGEGAAGQGEAGGQVEGEMVTTAHPVNPQQVIQQLLDLSDTDPKVGGIKHAD